MRFQRKSGLFRTFAVVINKDRIQKLDSDPRDLAWTRAIERLQSFARDEDERMHILPDEGHGCYIRKRLRQMRRNHYVGSAFGDGTLKALANRLIEDGSDRRSHESYFIQLADLNAYAAYKHEYPGNGYRDGAVERIGGQRDLAGQPVDGRSAWDCFMAALISVCSRAHSANKVGVGQFRIALCRRR
jgi:hypothetical protein